MELAELIVSRRTVHNYKNDKVPDALVKEALRLSLWAPNHRLTFPWVYFWTGPRSRARLADLAVELKSKGAPLSPLKCEAIRESVLNPSHLVVLGISLAAQESESANPSPVRLHEDYATLACSVQIGSLFLSGQGIGSKWTTSGFLTNPKTYEILGANPSETRLEGGLLIGIPKHIPPASERPPLEKFLRHID